MATEFEIIAELLLAILTITCIVTLILVGLLLRYLKQMKELLAVARAEVLPPPVIAAREGPAPKVPAPVAVPRGAGRKEVPGPAPAPAPAPAITPAAAAPAVDLVGGSPDIQGSILRLCEKYDLADFIIATQDGLLVVSLSPGSSEEAARFSDIYRRKKRPDIPGVTFLEMNHRGEPMLGIIRTDRPVTPEKLAGIGEDAREILNWWL